MFLRQALALAEIRRGFCAPNPAVGAVVVKNQQILATGYHYASGHPHAEAEALQKLDESAKGSTLYVTLEPCCPHLKKTPPCTDLLISRGISTVVYGFRDPNPEVAGRGEQLLREAGIECRHERLADIDEFYESYVYWQKTKQPFTTAKLALSLDGKIAGPQGQRVSITGLAAQHFTHQQRKRADAILTTAKTIYHDNPLLNVRLGEEQHAKTLYIIDRHLTTSLEAHIFSTAHSLIFFHEESAQNIDHFTERGARCISVTKDERGLNLREILKLIGKDGVHDLWVEAGGQLFLALAELNLLHCAYMYLAPKWLGPSAQSAFNDSLNLFTTGSCTWEILGEDVVCKITQRVLT